MRSLTDFLGDWTLTRTILQSDGTEGRFEGRARWQATEEGAEYYETGHLILPQGRFAAERRYRWTETLDVFFEDGRFFHSVPAQGGETGHWCDPDQYDVTYAFGAWPEWSCRWHVVGPRKNYTMTSVYRRG